ncbi:hypothetical protein Ccr32_gp320 [Caulobacter phage Ccr32]|uniref:Uncharacterized protein n=4 Tax=Viruses TaxID=10239 RepID=K4JTR9_9CAUD|nr:hypothetical protein D865_gp008 [Caulobacter phage phiCbK]YP_006988222.1 hypothetical protein D865_gp092 [Caulobacter phage phiCbK]ARB14927.1 hypothetical protein Ccr32_gp008 [Caulobacter phage Ccr32]ARB15258.1 hypothetical protein Ccr34_gp009 [Caulobacter phage Ccr34]AFU86840.1 hypothetical protein CbK_gp008 [Caulobacter phage phiCbK]AFU87158.1 hypothetical protein CbK_gp326 [Caulobacter phage phiCbK]ARB15238.1 hypothetical protein Ccr32_gp320 [Caulobacter phage Ccr32]
MTSHSMVAHRWAQDDENGRTARGFNMYFERYGRGADRVNVIFSYGTHFPAAAFVTDAHGRRVVLYTTHRRSVSTAKHLSHIRWAIPSGVPVFSVPNVSRMHKPGGAGDFHGDNLRAYIESAAGLAEKAKRARVYGPWLLSQARDQLAEAQRYADAFKVKGFKVPALEDVAGQWAKMTAAKARAEAKARKEAEKRAREAREAERLADAEAFAAWMRGERQSAPFSYRVRDDGTVYLRRFRGVVRDLRSQERDGSRVDELQTSQGAAVPWEHAVKAFRFIKLCRERGESFHRNGRVIRVGHFQVDAISPQGDMTAGCHRFAWDEIERLARAEGVFDLPAAADAVETRQAEPA